MQVKCEVNNRGNTDRTDVILFVSGKIDRLKDSIVLKSCINTMLEKCKELMTLTLDLGETTYLDSGALNVFIYTHSVFEKLGKKFIIIQSNEYIRDVLEVVGLQKLTPVLTSVKKDETQGNNFHSHHNEISYVREIFEGNGKHLDILFDAIEKNNISIWNNWRRSNSHVKINLKGLRLFGVDLSKINLENADISNAYLFRVDLEKSNLAGSNLSKSVAHICNFSEAVLTEAFLFDSDLSHSNFWHADLWKSNLASATLVGTIFRKAHLENANLDKSNIVGADLSYADLKNGKVSKATISESKLSMATLTQCDIREATVENSCLSGAICSKTDLRGSTLRNCSVHGISAWDIIVNEQTIQQNLVISPKDEPEISVDNLKIAQFIYMIRNTGEISKVLDLVSSKLVLILGNFSNEYKPYLNIVKHEFTLQGYAPVIFDFKGPAHLDTMETVSAIAHLSGIIVADLTNAKSVLQELQHIVPQLPSVSIYTLLHESRPLEGMFDHLFKFPSLKKPRRYSTELNLQQTIKEILAEVDPNFKELIISKTPCGKRYDAFVVEPDPIKYVKKEVT